MNIFDGIIIGFSILMFHAFTLIPVLGTSSRSFLVLISNWSPDLTRIFLVNAWAAGLLHNLSRKNILTIIQIGTQVSTRGSSWKHSWHCWQLQSVANFYGFSANGGHRSGSQADDPDVAAPADVSGFCGSWLRRDCLKCSPFKGALKNPALLRGLLSVWFCRKRLMI